MTTISKKLIFLSLFALSLWGIVFAHTVFAREVFICKNPAANENPAVAYTNPNTCDASCAANTCVANTVSDSAFYVWICNGDRTIVKNDVTACRVACDPANLLTPPPEKQCTQSFVSAALPPGTDQPPGGGTSPPPLPQANTPDGGIFQPLVRCAIGGQGPETCTLCEAFRLIHRIIQFAFYAIMLPLIAIAFIIGGIILLTAAGNETKITQGKSIVWNTFIGFLIAFGAWLIISTIIVNITPGTVDYPEGARLKWYQFPDCVPGSKSPIDIVGTTLTPPPIPPEPPPTGICSEGNLECEVNRLNTSSQGCFGSNIGAASKICQWESSGIANIPSGPDKCNDGTTFSWGLFQINIIAHADKLGGACQNLFSPHGNARPQGDCLQCNSGANPSGGVCTGNNDYCVRWSCTVNGGGGVNNAQYQQCIALAKNPTTNSQVACAISQGGINFSDDWKKAAQGCNLP